VRQWVLAITDTLSYVHRQHIVIVDICSRNALLDDDSSVELCDFANSALVPLDAEWRLVEANGATVQMDIFQFGSLVYEMLTRLEYKYDLFDNEEIDRQRSLHSNEEKEWEVHAGWARAEDLPKTDNLMFGLEVKRCWTKYYSNMIEVQKAFVAVESQLQ
jgi:serine/threonine protein kinase